MRRVEFDHFALGLGLLGIASPVFGLSHSATTDVVLAAGLIALAAAALQLVQLGGSTNRLAGDGSTFALYLSIGLGLVVVRLGSGSVPEQDS